MEDLKAQLQAPEAGTVVKKKPAKTHTFVTPEGVKMKVTLLPKKYRDIIRHHQGEPEVTVYDPAKPLGDAPITPGPGSPICKACGLCNTGSKTPYIAYEGSLTPRVTVIFESVSVKEDEEGRLGVKGVNSWLKVNILARAEKLGLKPSDFRWITLTRCANRGPKQVQYKDKGNYCRAFMLEDLKRHRPELIIPAGTAALGALSHKSNANDWAGRLLTFRGWPDDWLTDPAFALPRPDPTAPERKITGHPLFGPPPAGRSDYIPMVPVRAARLVLAAQNIRVTQQCIKHIDFALSSAAREVQVPSYLRPWYLFTDDVKRVHRTLKEMLRMPVTTLCYDTETTGVKPWASDAAIVTMMFRWKDAETGEPRSIGFPWNYVGLDFNNTIQAYIPQLAPLVLAVLYRHKLLGHNLPFDILYTFANLPGADLDKLCEAMKYDTWHMVYTQRQRPGTLGLESVTYDYAPSLAGYEEDMTLLIELHRDTMHPDGLVNGKRGHYANCPRDKWDSHLIPYVMGDVESCYQVHEVAAQALENTKRYDIPLADPTWTGRFRLFRPPNRAWVYKYIMSPASSTLTKMMGRGMEVDVDELERLEGSLPNEIREAKEKLRQVDQRIIDWNDAQQYADSSFELDLENKKHLKTVLFDILGLPIQRLTKTGKQIYGEDEGAYRDVPREELYAYAALDKFTLNKLAVDNEQVRPLQDYRKLYKLYTTYLRPMRNVTTEGIDKKERKGDQHLCYDERIHASFLLTGTRGGRLSCKCLSINTLVSTNRGIIELQYVRPGDKIQGSTGVTTVTAFEYTGLKQTLLIETKSGRRIKCSPDHMIYADGAWRRAEEVKEGTSLYISTAAGPECPRVKLAQVSVPDTRTKLADPIKEPEYLCERVAFLLGHYIAEGCIGFNKVRKSVNKGIGANQHGTYAAARSYKRSYNDNEKVPARVIIAYSQEERSDLAEFIANEYATLFGVSGEHALMGSTRSPVYCINSGMLGRWLLANGCGGYASEKRVPPAVFLSGNKVVTAFLRGMFEGDGSATSGSAKWSSDSEGLADDALLLLSRIGITATKGITYREDGTPRYHLYVRQESGAQAFDLFWSKRKVSQLRLKNEGTSSGVLNVSRYKLSTDAPNAYSVNRGRTKHLTRSFLAKCRGRWTTPEAETHAEWVLSSNAKSDVVTQVRLLGESEMCDISTEDKEFVVNGLRLHNSPNLQQLPRDGDVKSMFVSRFNKQGRKGALYQADLSQIELRLLACACGDPVMIGAYRDEVDLHTLTTSRIFKVPYEHFSKDYMKFLQESGKDKVAKELNLKRQIGKCVDPDTLVSVNGKIVRIGSIHDGRQDDTFYPMTGRIQGPVGDVPIVNFYSNGVKGRLLVCSRRGLVACSTEHPFLLKSGELRRAKDLKKGDALADPVPLKGEHSDVVVPFDPFGKHPVCNNFNVTVDADMAYVLGMFYGDGTSNLGEVSIATGGKPSFFEWQDIIAESVKKVGFTPTIRRTLWDSDIHGEKRILSGPAAGKVIKGAHGAVDFGCTRVSDLFVQLGAVEDSPKRRRTLKLPDWLFNAKLDVKLSFLAGWLDTDGHSARQGSLSGITKSWKLAQDLMVLMDTCGIKFAFEPCWNKTYDRYYYRINVSVEDSWRCFSKLLRLPAKRNALHKPKFVYKKRFDNTVMVVEALEPGMLIDVEVGTEDHLFICNSSTCRNTTNFLTGYGGGAFGLQTTLANRSVYMKIEECQKIIDAFFDSYPSLKRHLQHYKQFISDTGVALSILGRVRLFEEVFSEDKEAVSKALRAGYNHLIQSTASDMMLIALVCIEEMMREHGLESILVSTVHDSLLIDCLQSELPEVHRIANQVLNNFDQLLPAYFGADYDTSWMLTKFAGDAEVGLNYLNMRAVSEHPDWDAVLSALNSVEA